MCHGVHDGNNICSFLKLFNRQNIWLFGVEEFMMLKCHNCNGTGTVFGGFYKTQKRAIKSLRSSEEKEILVIRESMKKKDAKEIRKSLEPVAKKYAKLIAIESKKTPKRGSNCLYCGGIGVVRVHFSMIPCAQCFELMFIDLESPVIKRAYYHDKEGVEKVNETMCCSQTCMDALERESNIR